MRTNLLLSLGALVLAPAAFGQFDFVGGGSQSNDKPWESLKLNPKTRVRLAFQNANVDSILQFFQRATGITLVKDPALTGGLSLSSATAVSLSQALQILKTTLDLKGYDLTREGTLLVIKKKDQGGRGGFPSFDPSIFAGGGDNRTELKTYPIKFANATQVARVINEVFATAPGQGGGNPFQGGQFNRPGGQGGGQPGGRFGGFGGRGQQQQAPTVRASADDFSNSVIVNAPNDRQREVGELVKSLDKQTEEPQKTRVFKLQFAVASEAAPVIQNVLVSNAPRGRGGIGSSNVNPGDRFQQALRFGSAQASFGQVAADDRTNSLVVTATDDNITVVERVVKELDIQTPLQSTTFVFPLENARSDNIATLLQGAFGNRQGIGGGGGGAFRNQQQNGRVNQNNQNRNNNRVGNRGTEKIDPEKELAVDVDPNSEEGMLQTNVNVAQGFGGGFGGGGRQGGFGQQNRQNTLGPTRDADGRVINARDLTGQVTAISDPNTNSIIVVTTPDNAEIIRGILTQLDKIPEQVVIQTIIVEATLDNATKLGIEFNFTDVVTFGQAATSTIGTGFGLANANPALQGFRYTLANGKLGAFINALRTDTRFNVLSTPRIFTSNNVQAEINISQRVPFVTSSRQDVNGGFTFVYDFTDVGIVLNVTPRITSNGYVTMDITQTANDLQGFTDFNAPIINQRQADTTVSVRDGETVILGGIIRNQVTSTVRKVPLLGDIPLLGQLFRSTDKRDQKTELLVFLQPRIVRDAEEAKKLREEAQREMSDLTRKQVGTLIPPPPALPPGVEPPKAGDPNRQGPPPTAPVKQGPPPIDPLKKTGGK